MRPGSKSNAVAAFALAAAIAAPAALAQMPTVELTAGIHLIRAEVANTSETRAQGLMFRKVLGPNEGMLFVFPQAEVVCMWMRSEERRVGKEWREVRWGG